MSELVVDITLYIIKGGVVRLVLLRLVQEGEELVRILSAADIIVDQAYKDALDFRIFSENFL